jgi:hypothetical protein
VRVLLKGGAGHDWIVAVPPGKRELYVAVPFEINYIKEEYPDPRGPAIEVDRYEPSSYKGYAPGSGAQLPIWIYVGRK